MIDAINTAMLDVAPAGAPEATGSDWKSNIVSALKNDGAGMGGGVASPDAAINATGGSLNNLNATNNSNSMAQKIGEGLKGLGNNLSAGARPVQQQTMPQIAPLQSVTQNIAVPQAAPVGNMMPQMAPIQMPQVMATSDIKSKYKIESAMKETNDILNAVYNNIMKRRNK